MPFAWRQISNECESVLPSRRVTSWVTQRQLEAALDICGQYERKLVMTGRDTGATGAEFAAYLMETMSDPGLLGRWEDLQAQSLGR